MVTIADVTELVAELGGLAILAGTLAAVGAFVYRWYVREEIPRGLTLLLGLSGVAIYLNTTTALGQVIGGSGAPTETEVALFNITAFLVGAGGATLGQWAGDWAGTELFSGGGFAEVEDDVGRLVQSVGRVVAVELPQDIDDVVGYDPVPEETKETLAGKTFLFPRRVTVSELRERLVARLKTDYGVGHVDIELADDGSVTYLALGSRAAGIGPTLPPATNAVAIRADPAFAASAGDLVQVWETDPMRRVLTAELRGVAEDTVTVAIDAADTQKLDPRQEYRLVTLPVEDRPDREFASLLRAADETFSSVTVEAGSPLHGLPIGALDLTVVAIKPEDETPMALPDPATVLAPGDVVFVIARPDALRRLEAASEPLDPALVREPSPPQRSRGVATDTTPPSDQPDPAPSETAEDPQSVTDAEPVSEGVDAADDPLTESSDDATAGDTEDDPDQPTGESPATAEADADGTDAADFDPPAASDAGPDGDTDDAGKADSSSFQQLKSEFESGDADWAEGESATGDDSAAASASDSTGDSESAVEDDGDDGLDSALGAAGEDLDGLDIGDDADDDDDLVFDDGNGDLGGVEGDEADDFEFDDGGDDTLSDDDLDSLSFDDGEDEDDDLSSLSFDEDDDSGLSLDDDDSDGGADEEDEEEAEGQEEDDEDDDDSGGGGGASSFQQLKEEFDSGDADWEDDISDSPGGDMRLDE